MKYIKKFTNNAEYEEYVATKHPTPNVSLAVEENEVHYEPIHHDYSQDYLTFVAKDDGSFKFSATTSSAPINYSLDGGETWNELRYDNSTPTITSGNKIIWKAMLTPRSGSTSFGIGIFKSSAKFDIEGNPMSLLFGDDFKDKTSLVGKSHAFCFLFSGNTNVVSAENLSLPAMTLVTSSYSNMFRGCTSLTTPPKVLSATTLAQYCYSSMFIDCSSLTVPPELPAETLASDCYGNMFTRCVNLQVAPVLSSTTLANGCYSSMFYGCTSLMEAPKLPTLRLVERCYAYMFQNCTNLNHIECLATNISPNGCTERWVESISSSGTFIKNRDMSSWPTIGVNGIPYGWTVQDAS